MHIEEATKPDLALDQSHGANPGKHQLAREGLSRYSVRKSVRVRNGGLTDMSQEHVGVCTAEGGRGGRSEGERRSEGGRRRKERERGRMRGVRKRGVRERGGHASKDKCR